MKVKDASKPKDGFQSLTRLLPYAKPYTLSFLAVLALVIIYNATNVLQPYIVKIAIDNNLASKHPNVHGLYVIALVYVVVVVVGLIANYAQIQLLQYAGQSVIRTIRLDLFRHILRQSMRFFDNNAIGRLVTNVSSDTETVSQFFTNFFLTILRDGLSVVMIIFAMFRLDARIAGICMIVIPVIGAISVYFRGRLRRAYQTTRTRLSNIVAFLAENLAGMRIIQIFHQEPRQANAFETLNEAHRQANVREYRTSVWFNRVLDLVGNLSVAFVVWVGGLAVFHHAMLFGTLYAFISYIQRFFQPINSLTQQWNTLQSAMIAADRIGGVLSVEPEIRDKEEMFEVDDVTKISGDIQFHGVTFGYNPEHPVLHDVTFRVEAGSFIGIVGATGAGKSSVISLLTRFYEPQEGRILLDGTDIQDFSQADLHRLVGLVQQDVSLFTGTVAENIRLFRTEVTLDEVVRAAKIVGAHDVLERLPNGYETMLYAKGSNLSAGERQLISFARIVAFNPRVLILDEATASLDSQTEQMVQNGLLAVAKNRTTLVIAHRLSTIRHADSILVFERGRIIERGTHDELVRLGGYYADLEAKSGVGPEPIHSRA